MNIQNFCNINTAINVISRAKFNRINMEPRLPQHPNCDCYCSDVKTIQAGTVSRLGQDGPDYWLKHYGRLPYYYITKEAAETLGWKKGKNTIGGIAPTKMLGATLTKTESAFYPKKREGYGSNVMWIIMLGKEIVTVCIIPMMVMCFFPQIMAKVNFTM